MLYYNHNGAQYVYQGDCRTVIDANYNDWHRAFDFVFADPPFNIGEPYSDHNDNMPSHDFESFTASWLQWQAALMRDGGIFAINVPDSMVQLILNKIPETFNRIDWVIWHYRFAQCHRAKFLSSKTHCLIFRRGDTLHTWNPEEILVPSDRATKYNDPRVNDTANGGERVPFDVWYGEQDGPGWGRVTGNSSERVSPEKGYTARHPNQLPEAYLERLLRAYTRPGGLVFDGFGGCGTTATVAAALGRACVTCELSQAYCDDIVIRLKKGSVRI